MNKSVSVRSRPRVSSRRYCHRARTARRRRSTACVRPDSHRVDLGQRTDTRARAGTERAHVRHGPKHVGRGDVNVRAVLGLAVTADGFEPENHFARVVRKPEVGRIDDNAALDEVTTVGDRRSVAACRQNRLRASSSPTWRASSRSGRTARYSRPNSRESIHNGAQLPRRLPT